MTTKITNSNLLVIIAVAAVSFPIGYAGAQTNNTKKTKSMLTAAGFRTRTPKTAKQKELYAALPSNKVERGTVKGKVFYVFKDEKAGVAYVGGEPEHRRYQQLCMQQRVAQPPEEEMKHPFAESWSNQWGARIE